MDMKVQGSRSGTALGIGELLASACSASATQDHNHAICDIDIIYTTDHSRGSTKAQGSSSGKLCRVASCCQQ